MNKFFTKLTVVLLFLVGGMSAVFAQSALKLGGNPYFIDSSAALELSSTTRGFLPPRVTSETSINSPAKGLMVYNKGKNALLVNIGTDATPQWFSVTSDATPTITSAKQAYTVSPTDQTVLCDASTAAFTLTLPVATTSKGRIIVIGKLDDANTVTFSQGIKVGDQSMTTLNFPMKPFRIQSNGTDWIAVDVF